MAISATQVKALRDRTGLGMMACKKALEEADGDIDAAIDLLRKSGAMKREKKAGRAQNDGLIAARSENGNVGMLEFRCETDFVARNADVRALVDRVLEVIMAEEPSDAGAVESLTIDGQTVKDALEELINKTGENLAFGNFRIIKGGMIGSYVHHDRKSAAMIKLDGTDDQELADEMAMHIVFAQPAYLKRDDVPQDMVEREKEVILASLKDDPKMAGKPPQILEKIADGKINSFFADVVLPDQPYFKESKTTVLKYLENKAKGASITEFCLLKVGGEK